MINDQLLGWKYFSGLDMLKSIFFEGGMIKKWEKFLIIQK